MDPNVFWPLATSTVLAGTAVVYHHAVYPLILKRAAAKQAAGDRARPVFSSDTAPRIDIIMPAYNEAEQIAWKLGNLAALDYPTDRLRILIGCDGCTDTTVSEARAAVEDIQTGLQIDIVEFETNRGKVAVLNDMISNSDADVIVLTDVSAELPRDALTLGAAHFQNDTIGVVAGTYCMATPGSAGENAYWKYQTTIKRGEAALGAPLGVHGAFYMFRRNAFHTLPPDTINDDFILPMEIVADGLSAVYDERIVALETETASTTTDLKRRRRIAAGNAQQLVRLARLLHPRHGGVAFAFLSGKALRVVMPFLLLIALAGSLVLAPHSDLFAATAVLQLAGYGIAGSHWLFPEQRAPKLIAILKYILTGHAASLVGVLRYALGLDRGPWRRAVDV